MPQLDPSTYVSQVFWLIVSFSLMLLIMRFVIVPKISKIIDERQRYIENFVRRAEKLQEQALSSLEGYNGKISDAEKIASEETKKAKEELDFYIAKKNEETSAILSQKIKESEDVLKKQREEALETAKTAARDISSLILKQLGIASAQNLQKQETLPLKEEEDGR